MPLRRYLLAVSCVLGCVGCARTEAIQPIGVGFMTQAPPAPAVSPRLALAELATAPENASIASELAGLALAETDGRCRAFLEAGARAWAAGCREAARSLWGMALDCRPTRPICLPVGEAQAVLVHRPLDRGEMPPLGDFGSPAVRRTFDDFMAVDLHSAGPRDREADLAGLVSALLPPTGPDGCVLVRGGLALELLQVEGLATRAEELLAFAQRQRDALITIEARWVRFPLDAQGTNPLFEPKEGRELDRQELERLRVAHGGEILSMPRLTMFPGQTANIAVVRTLSYVADYTFSASSSGDFVADPVVATAIEGATIEACAVVAPGAIALRIAPASCEVAEPMPELQIKVRGTGQTIAIQTPRAARFAVARVVSVPTGRTRWIPVGMGCDATGARYGIGIAVEASATPLVAPAKPAAPVKPAGASGPTPPAKPVEAAPPSEK